MWQPEQPSSQTVAILSLLISDFPPMDLKQGGYCLCGADPANVGDESKPLAQRVAPHKDRKSNELLQRIADGGERTPIQSLNASLAAGKEKAP